MLNQSLVDSWSFFKNHIVAISLIILPIVVPIDVMTVLYNYFLVSDEYVLSEQMVPMIVGYAAYPIYAAGIVFYIDSVIAGERIDIKASWRLAAKFWLPYVIMLVFVGFVIMLGLALLIIPGVIFALRYSFVEFDLLLNKSKPLDAMKNSWNETGDYLWVLLGGYVVITFVLYVPYYLVASLFDEKNITYWVLGTVSSIAYSLFGALYTIFAFRVYTYAKSQNSQLLIQDAP